MKKVYFNIIFLNRYLTHIYIYIKHRISINKIKHVRNTIYIKIRNLVIITYISFIVINDTIQKFQSFNR